MKLSGWGRYPVLDCPVATPRDEAELARLLEHAPLIARGNGRSYGDSALSPSLTVSMARFNHMIDFDGMSGLLTVEAGVMLGDVIAAFLPRGRFPPVTPGTKYVTIGGMIAADVHGKNHHNAGSFGRHVAWLDLLTGDGKVRRCSRESYPDLFHATIGGMGLTGIILRATFRLIRVETAWMRQETLACANLDEAMTAFENSAGWTYSVAWIDCLSEGEKLGRSLLYRAEHAGLADLSRGRAKHPLRARTKPGFKVPFDAPSATLNRHTVRAFNEVYHWRGRTGPRQRLIDWDTYFYPLDGIREWNRIYGGRGFAQFQCVLPLDASRAGLTALLTEISQAGQGSFLAVLKLFGKQESAFSFPMEGYTLALDFPATEKAIALIDRLGRITAVHGGRIYLAKDSCIAPPIFESMETRAEAFRALREKYGLAARFRSAQSERLAL